MIEAVSKEEGVRVIRAGFGRVLLDVTFQCSAPIYWFRFTAGHRGPVLNNGTIFFVDAGAGPFAVTARHVLEGFRSAVTANGTTLCEIGGEAFDPSENRIDEDSSADIATFRIEPTILARLKRVPHQNPRAWPPKPPEEGKGIFFGGYPGRHRVERPGVIQWGFAGGLEVAATVRADRLSIQFSREDWVPQQSLQPPQVGEPWGGVSGGPVFAVVQNSVVSWRLAGVATEFNSTFEILFASPLSRVQPDGTITRD